MSVDAFELILVMAVFLGAIVQGFSGFAFSAVAGAILLQVQAPGLAIPLLMICSLLIQTYVLVRLRATLSLHGSLPYLVGGAGGVVLATLAFDRIDPHVFRQGFGAFLMVYALSTVVRPRAALLDMKGRPVGHTAVGFAGGLVGGLTAMPGAVLAIWCDAHAIPKLQQRSIVQPFIAAMQALALVFLMLKAPRSTGRLAAASAVRLAGPVRRLGAGPLPVRQGERSGLSPGDLRAAVLLRHRAGGMKALHIAAAIALAALIVLQAAPSRAQALDKPDPSVSAWLPGCRAFLEHPEFRRLRSVRACAPARSMRCSTSARCWSPIIASVCRCGRRGRRSSRPSSRISRRCARKSIARISRAWCWGSCASTGRAANEIAAPRTGDWGCSPSSA